MQANSSEIDGSKCFNCGVKLKMSFKLSRIELQALKDFFDGKLMEEIEMFLQNSLFSAK